MGECLAGREALCDADEPDLRQTERSAEVGGMEGAMEGWRERGRPQRKHNRLPLNFADTHLQTFS